MRRLESVGQRHQQYAQLTTPVRSLLVQPRPAWPALLRTVCVAIALGRGRLAVCGGDGNRGDVGDGREPSFVINRYRTATIGLHYYGDSVANSWGDILSCAIGFVAARYLGLWVSIAVFVLIEVAGMFWIRAG